MKIVRREIPARVVYEDDLTLALLDINPVEPGHTLVIPKTPVRNVFDADKDSWEAVMQTVHRIAPLVRDAVGAKGVHINSNHEPEAGQDVFHLHVHIIPRNEHSSFALWPKKEMSDEEMDRVAEAIRAKAG